MSDLRIILEVNKRVTKFYNNEFTKVPRETYFQWAMGNVTYTLRNYISYDVEDHYLDALVHSAFLHCHSYHVRGKHSFRNWPHYKDLIEGEDYDDLSKMQR